MNYPGITPRSLIFWPLGTGHHQGSHIQFGKFPMQMNGGFIVCGGSFLRGLKISQNVLFSMNCYPCPPPSPWSAFRLVCNSFKSRSITFWGPFIASILATGCFTKIAKPIIRRVAICVIQASLRPPAFHVEKRKMIGENPASWRTVQRSPSGSIGSVRPIAGLNPTPGFHLPKKSSRFRVVMVKIFHFLAILNSKRAPLRVARCA